MDAVAGIHHQNGLQKSYYCNIFHITIVAVWYLAENRHLSLTPDALFLDPRRTYPWPPTHLSLTPDTSILEPGHTSHWPKHTYPLPGRLIFRVDKRQSNGGQKFQVCLVKAKYLMIYVCFCGQQCFLLGNSFKYIKQCIWISKKNHIILQSVYASHRKRRRKTDWKSKFKIYQQCFFVRVSPPCSVELKL